MLAWLIFQTEFYNIAIKLWGKGDCVMIKLTLSHIFHNSLITFFNFFKIFTLKLLLKHVMENGTKRGQKKNPHIKLKPNQMSDKSTFIAETKCRGKKL